MSAPVYDATNGPSAAAVAVASPPIGRIRRVTADAAATAAAGVYAAIAHDPMFIGDVGLNTRSMLMKRLGLPRSCTRPTMPREIAPAAPTFAPRASTGRPVTSAAAAITDAVPAS